MQAVTINRITTSTSGAGQAKAGRVIHGFQPGGGKAHNFFCHRSDRLAGLLQTRDGMDQNIADHVWDLRHERDWFKRDTAAIGQSQTKQWHGALQSTVKAQHGF
jgi:hypothetical protein